MARKQSSVAALKQPQAPDQMNFPPSGRARLEAIYAEYTRDRSKAEFEPEEWADNPAHFAEEALRCLSVGDTDQGVWWAMCAAALSSGLDWMRPHQAALNTFIRQRQAQAKKHRANPSDLAEGYEKMAKYRTQHPGCSKTAAAKWAERQLERRVSYKTLLNHLACDAGQSALWND
jgi:hypothetical protein